MSEKKVRGRPKVFKRDEVIEKAKKVFWLKGFEGSHLQELVKECGVNRFSLYKEFGGKDGLFKACLESYLEEARNWYCETLMKKPLNIRNIKDYFKSLAPAKYKGCFYVNTIIDKTLIKKDAFESVKQFSREVEKFFFTCLKSSFSDWSEEKLGEAAKFLVALDQGMAVFDTARGSSEELEVVKKASLSFLDSLENHR